MGKIPVNFCVFTAIDMTPAQVTASMGYGLWEEVGAGALLGGADSTHPVNTLSGTNVLSIEEANLPAHSHATTVAVCGGMDFPADSPDPNGNMLGWTNDPNAGGDDFTYRTNGAEYGQLGGVTSDPSGSNVPITLDPRRYSLHVWRRVA